MEAIDLTMGTNRSKTAEDLSPDESPRSPSPEPSSTKVSEDTPEEVDVPVSPSSCTTEPSLETMMNKESSADQGLAFRKDEQVFIKATTCQGEKCHPYWYRGKIIDVGRGLYESSADDMQKSANCYKIRYKDSSSKYDEWLFADALMSCIDPENQAKAAKDNERYGEMTSTVTEYRKLSGAHMKPNAGKHTRENTEHTDPDGHVYKKSKPE